MRDDPTLRVSLGFVDPLYMIFFTVVAIGLALIYPVFDALLKDTPILLWHWLCLGGGIAVLAGCAWFIVRENRE